jgi:hypothetical protein
MIFIKRPAANFFALIFGALCLLAGSFSVPITSAPTVSAASATSSSTPHSPLVVKVGTEPGAIAGAVTETDGAGVGEVKVDLFEAKTPWIRGKFLGSARTDDDGGFRFGPLEVGCYISVAIAPQGRTFTNGSRYRQNHRCVTDPEPPDRLITAGAIFQRAGITGLVAVDDPELPVPDEPVPDVEVDLFEAKTRWSRGAFLGKQRTDADGFFRFESPAQGCYILVVIAPEGSVFANGTQWLQIYGCAEDAGRPGPDRPLCAGQVVTVYLAEGDQPTEGPDVIVGTDGDDVINAGGGDDVVCAGGGDDTVKGGEGGDLLLGEEGADTLDGGPGPDTIEGGPGGDQLDGGAGADTIAGGEGDDQLAGGSETDLLLGDGGADRINGHAGNDRLFGGPGPDALDGGDGDDVLAGEAGDDSILGGKGADEVNGGAGRDEIDGQGGDDELSGGPDPGVIDGGDGDDVLIGHSDADRLAGGEGDDEVYGREGDDTISGGSHDGVETAGDDVLDGGVGDDVVRGLAGADRLLGGEGADDLDGGNGDDRLIGGDGDNLLTGGAGEDIFVEPRGTFAVEAGDEVERNYVDTLLGGFFETCDTSGFLIGPISRSFECQVPWFLFEHENAALSYEWGLDVFFDCRPDGVIVSEECFAKPPGVTTFLDGDQPHHDHFRDAYRTYRSWGLQRPYTWEPYRGLENWPEATTIGAIFTADDRFGSRSAVPGVIEYGRTPDLSRRQVHRDMFMQFAFAYVNDDVRDSRSLADFDPAQADQLVVHADQAALDSLADWAADRASGADFRCDSTASINCDLAAPLDGFGYLLWEYITSRFGDVRFIGSYLTELDRLGSSEAAVQRLLGANWRVGYQTWANARIAAGTLTCPAPCGAIAVDATRTWAVPGAATTGVAGRPIVRALGGQVAAGLAADALVRYFMTFDLDAKFEETYATWLFPMLADLPDDDLELTVSQYELLPWTEPAIPPYDDDPRQCVNWSGALGPAMRAFIDRRATDPNISGRATIAVAMYCIDNKIGGAAARSGGANVSVPALPGLSFDPGTAATRRAFGLSPGDRTPNHAETNLLASLIVGVPILPESVGVIYMLVDNPSQGVICDRCLGIGAGDEDWLPTFQRTFPGVRLSVIARNNAFQDGEIIESTPDYLWDELLG